MLQFSVELNFPGADGGVEHIRVVAVPSAQLDQFPHQLISFIRSHLIKSGNGRAGLFVPVVEHTGTTGIGVVGDGDVEISFHASYFLSVPLLEHPKYIRRSAKLQE